MNKLILNPTNLMLLLLMASCHSNKQNTGLARPGSTGNEILYSHTWNLEELNGKLISVVQGRTIYLLFGATQANSVTGTTGCNNLIGTAALPGKNEIKFSPMAVTKMACPGTNTEAEFLEMLRQADNWSIIDTKLILSRGKKALARFTAAEKPAAANTSKLNGTWELNFISGPRIAFDGLYPDKKPVMTLTTDKNEVRGNTGCNSFNGKFKTEGNSINFSEHMAMTLMACSGDGERVFIETLKKINHFSAGDDTLTLLIGDIVFMRFSKKQ